MLKLLHRGNFSFLNKGILSISIFALICIQFIVCTNTSVKASSISSSSWSGYIARDNSDIYREASSYFTVPRLAPIADTTVSIWAGLGGERTATSPAVLVQTVIASSWNSTDGQINNGYWEFFGDHIPSNLKGRHPMDLDLHIGDQLWVYASSNMNNNGKDSFVIRNLTTGKTAMHEEDNTTVFSNSASAECVVESPISGMGGDPVPLANFGRIAFTGCTISTDKQGRMIPIGCVNNDKMDIVRNSTTLATTSPLNSRSDFTVTWHHT